MEVGLQLLLRLVWGHSLDHLDSLRVHLVSTAAIADWGCIAILMVAATCTLLVAVDIPKVALQHIAADMDPNSINFLHNLQIPIPTLFLYS